MAYSDPVRLILKGDRAKAARYINDARRLIFNLVRELHEGGVLSGRRLHRFMDGTTIGIVVAGMQVTAVIDVRSAEEKKRDIGDIVVWARDSDHPEGIDTEYPQQILNPPNESGGTWKTYFYSPSTPGYAAFAGKKGTYQAALPDGVRRAGNIDWYNEDEEIISWYGPSGRYWPDAYVQPRFQYGKFVFMLGDALLDTDQYALDSEEQAHGDDRYIVGAALRTIGNDTWLYTVQSEALDTPFIPTTQYMDDMLTAGCPYSQQENAGGIYRYALTRSATPEGLQRYHVTPNSRQKLADLPGNHAEPWFFNQSATVAHCYELPSNGWFCRAYFFENESIPPDPEVPITVPDTHQNFREAFLAEDGSCTFEVTSMTAEFGTATHFVADYKGDERVYGYVEDMTRTIYDGFEEYNAGYPYGPVGFRIAGLQFWQLQYATNLSFFPNPNNMHRAYFMFADLRTDLLVLRVDNGPIFVPPGGVAANTSVDIYRNGERIYASNTEPDRPFSANSTPGYAYQVHWATGRTTAVSFPPYFYLYGVTVTPVFQDVTDDYTTLVYGGCSPGMMWSPYPPEAYFNFTAGFNDLDWSAPLVRMSTQAPNGGQGNAADFDGHYSVFACSSTAEMVAMSGYLTASDVQTNPYAFNGNYSVFYIQNGTLPTLTGVGGEFRRYHPLWRLGKPAGGSTLPV